MTKQTIIERTIKVINQLPEEKVVEISEFAEFIFKRYEELELLTEIQNTVSESASFEFLNNEEDLYTEKDLKEKFND